LKPEITISVTRSYRQFISFSEIAGIKSLGQEMPGKAEDKAGTVQAYGGKR
jgi:hypothetical protein